MLVPGSLKVQRKRRSKGGTRRSAMVWAHSGRFTTRPITS